MKRLIATVLLFSLPSAVLAEDWTRLTGSDVTNALNARHLVYESGATQGFGEDGSTRYTGGGPTMGQWRVKEHQYCSIWPPSDAWTCYDVERSTDGKSLRFTGPDGSQTVGRYDR
ncbi:hypothetical protein OU426_01135 [Frigidibacter sp. RF13]|uniref:hypothetical protein n=1 Tax=Frigidibacter sp. RF13 TaxID=2997340 RepID=UPI002271AE49|nr:hypothetical protein [Frigidibacter sp. RF13]MCY1125445.1 hypothetical protein [Frigidibacter sp. RF13]